MIESADRYNGLIADLYKQAAMQHQPVGGTFELTNRCNLYCQMCYIRHDRSNRRVKQKEMDALSWVKLAEQAANNGMVFLVLTGGEIFLRRDFFEIYTPLTQMGLMITLLTNGTLLTERIVKRLAENPPSLVEVTLYGASKSVYESITGKAASYEKCCRGIQLLLEHGIKLGLKTTLTRQNISELEAMEKMAANLGVPFATGWLLIKRRDNSFSEVCEHRLSAKEGVELELENDHSGKELKNLTGKTGPNNCYAGRCTFSVNPSGEMNMCSHLPFPGIQPLETGFETAWDSVKNTMSAMPPLSPDCLQCEYLSYCPYCPAWSYSETGTLNSMVPYLCSIAKIRKEMVEQTVNL